MAGTDATLRAAAGDRPDDVSGLIAGAAGTLGATATESDSLSSAIHAAPGAMQAAQSVLPEADPLLDDLTRASRAVGPLRPSSGHPVERAHRGLETVRDPEGFVAMLARGEKLYP